MPGWTSAATSERPSAAARTPVRAVKPITLVKGALWVAAVLPFAMLVRGFLRNDLTALQALIDERMDTRPPRAAAGRAHG